MMRKLLILCTGKAFLARAALAFFLFLAPLSASAKIFRVTDYNAFGPLPVRSQNPLFLLFVNNPLERATTLEPKHWDFALENSFSNLYERNVGASTDLDLDMEIIRTSLKVKRGITQNLELGMEIPFMNFTGGFLDSFIQSYHEAFGFPNAGRDLQDNGRFSYRVSQDGTVLYQVDQTDFGLSDITLYQKLQLFEESKAFPAIALKTALKLPTGRASQGTGSNRPDGSLSLIAEKSYKRLHSYTQIGFNALGGHPNLDSILYDASFIFAQAFEFNLTDHLSFITQLNGQSPQFKDVDIPQLSEDILDLTFGLTGEVALKNKIRKIRYLFGFTEDPLTNGPSVDFTVFLSVGMEM